MALTSRIICLISVLLLISVTLAQEGVNTGNEKTSIKHEKVKSSLLIDGLVTLEQLQEFMEALGLKDKAIFTRDDYKKIVQESDDEQQEPEQKLTFQEE